MTTASKITLFTNQFLNSDGGSDLINRYELPAEFAYTSGDGIFRSDGTLGKKYKFFRFSPSLDYNKVSRCWTLTEDERQMLQTIHSGLTFPISNDKEYKGGGKTVYYIQFFGLGVEIRDLGIRTDIRNEICKNPCANCGTTKEIQCDHKNDLKNDPRVLDTKTQTMDDFQPLCRHCNDVKRAVKATIVASGKRHSAELLGFPIGFVEGDETLDLDDPYWYKGTYWGDCLAFKKQMFSR
jgi:hypothetical protein